MAREGVVRWGTGLGAVGTVAMGTPYGGCFLRGDNLFVWLNDVPAGHWPTAVGWWPWLTAAVGVGWVGDLGCGWRIAVRGHPQLRIRFLSKNVNGSRVC